MVDAARLKQSWAYVVEQGDEVPLFFYSWLFLRCPETRHMFPPSTSAQRDRFVGALGQMVADVDDLEALVPFLEQLGRDHRKFGVEAQHYPLVGMALLGTLEHFLGEAWSPELSADWNAAYALFSSVMSGAADRAAGTSPPWWDGEIVAHERRALDIAVLTVRPEPHLAYQPGQSIAVQTDLRPRLWRYYSPANAPRPDGTIELHVHAIDGGWVSSALVHSAGVGDVLRLGAPVGHRLTLDQASPNELLLVAGGTGLAPLRALVEQLVEEGRTRQVNLYFGARTEAELYDLPALYELAGSYADLTVVPVVSDQDGYAGERGLVADVAVSHGPWDQCDVYVCGGPAMVPATIDRLTGAGVARGRIRYEPAMHGLSNDAHHEAHHDSHDDPEVPPEDADDDVDISSEGAPDAVGVLASGGEQA